MKTLTQLKILMALLFILNAVVMILGLKYDNDVIAIGGLIGIFAAILTMKQESAKIKVTAR